MKQHKTFADFKEEWSALNRKLRIMVPNYSARRRVQVGDEAWTVVADMGCELAAHPRITVLNPPDWTPPTLTDADGKAIEAPLPSEVQEALTVLNAEMKSFFDGAACFPDGDVEGIGLVLPEKEKS